MKTYRFSELNDERLENLCRRNPLEDPGLMDRCRAIFEEVQKRGDQAVREYTRQFDRVEVGNLAVTGEEIDAAKKELPAGVLQALRRAAENIRAFHAAQLVPEKAVEVRNGILCWRESRAIRSVGLYVPGGTAVLPSTALMLATPARVAGCERIVLCVAPQNNGRAPAAVLAAAEMAGVREVFKIGGAQAIAALALGTETVPKVDKIAGPGSRIVQTAKLLANLHGTAIDMVAGPTEVLVVADDSASPDFVAADLLAQAEHGSDSQAVLVSTSGRLIEQVNGRLGSGLEALPRKALAAGALECSFAVVVETLDQAFEFSNKYAPEHLILHTRNPRSWLAKIQSAGSVFLGSWSPEVAGDYASGTNHTLPTSGMARAYSGVSVDTFVKKITFQELSREGLKELAPTLETLADLEGLEGHRRAVQIRFDTD